MRMYPGFVRIKPGKPGSASAFAEFVDNAYAAQALRTLHGFVLPGSPTPLVAQLAKSSMKGDR
eukprot:NODE_1698_length_908_cov_21.069849_g945_i1.p7 GENE.NODE_1698_length_908_cov_21.069849_g945_i1~~NODE_1698_length_908_cov_21.069849_g945_i1.p7  ORF type:complete len:63 (-),score=22.67 NODE_1698_length_908_cov_21.069849_g945_i1:182-370(-)